jgi:AIPR protein
VWEADPVSSLKVRHVAAALHGRFDNLIDISDVSAASEEHCEAVFLTRALAAQAVQRITGIDAATAARSVTDGSGDNGVDAVYIDPDNAVVLVQTKWSKAGTGSIGLGETRNFIAGLKDLTDENYGRFNAKFQAYVPDLQAALQSPDVKFVMVVATTGTPEFADPIKDAFADMEAELNDGPTPLVRVDSLGLNDFHSAITSAAGAQRVDLEVVVEHWGMVTEPFEAYYGTVPADAVASWAQKHGDALFEQNIRKPLGTTAVNQRMGETLDSTEQHFWYFNNGITALCSSIKRLAKGAGSRNVGEFVLSGVSIVNGAQTVGAIARASKSRGADDLLQARVWVRFISLEGCPPEFASQVTQATNTQNTVEGRDFVALDPEQGRLRTDLTLSLKKIYSIKRGEDTPQPEHGCTVTDATIALACASDDSSLAVIAKSAIGRFWESTTRAPYKTLFNSGTTAYRLWRAVQVSREVESILETERSKLDGRARAVAVQRNRIVLHLMFQELDLSRIDDPDFDWDGHIADLKSRTQKILKLVVAEVETQYPNNYITSLFKNAGRCSTLLAGVKAKRSAASN